jgi:hypothetical protein
MAIFSYRQNNTLIREAAVPATPTITSGRIYAEISGTVNTGIAIANPNPTPAIVTFYFTDRSGVRFGEGALAVPPNGQTARFLSDPVFNAGATVLGTFSFSSTQPVAVTALRGLTNERGEFLITTLPVADLSVPSDSDPLVFPHFADGGGWTTQILLVNTTDAAMSGTVQFSGRPAQDYSIPVRSATRIVTPGTDTGVLTGSVRVVPASGTRTPAGVAVFSFTNRGVTVTAASVPALRPGNAFRLYAESFGASGQIGSLDTGFAVANPSSNSITVTFELTTATGITTGLTSSMVVGGNGQTAMFLRQLFPSLPDPFQGLLRISTPASTGISMVGLRGRYNERNDFLITTTPPANESAATSAELFFPHFASGGGYTTQLVLFNGTADQSSAGLIRFVSQSGQPLSVVAR